MTTATTSTVRWNISRLPASSASVPSTTRRSKSIDSLSRKPLWGGHHQSGLQPRRGLHRGAAPAEATWLRAPFRKYDPVFCAPDRWPWFYGTRGLRRKLSAVSSQHPSASESSPLAKFLKFSSAGTLESKGQHPLFSLLSLRGPARKKNILAWIAPR